MTFSTNSKYIFKNSHIILKYFHPWYKPKFKEINKSQCRIKNRIPMKITKCPIWQSSSSRYFSSSKQVRILKQIKNYFLMIVFLVFSFYLLIRYYQYEYYTYFWVLLAILIIERLVNLLVVNWYFVEVHDIQECWLVVVYCIILNFTFLDTIVISHNAMKFEER